jgi:2,3-bisphosphoglycerate-independent phosphoglycerate mutase
VEKVDSSGEDGNFKEKSHRIEEFDALLPRITGLRPDALVLTGDHSPPEPTEEPHQVPPVSSVDSVTAVQKWSAQKATLAFFRLSNLCRSLLPPPEDSRNSGIGSQSHFPLLLRHLSYNSFVLFFEILV